GPDDRPDRGHEELHRAQGDRPGSGHGVPRRGLGRGVGRSGRRGPGMSATDTPRELVANRGVIAVRVIRAAHTLGWQAVAIHSEADADQLWVRLADDAVHVGASAATKSYLDMDAVLRAATDSGCGYVHPGYGFLSERPEFA